MRDLLLRALRFFILGAAAGGVGTFTVLHADDGATPAKTPPPATAPPAKPSIPDDDAPPPPDDNTIPSGTQSADKSGPKVFTPTQEISPDQEIDFPADL